MQDLLAELKEYIRFGVAENDYDLALGIVEQYRGNSQVLRLLHKHYSALPDAVEQPVTRVVLQASRQGVTLYSVVTPETEFLYVASREDIVWLGYSGDRIDGEVLSFFELGSEQELKTLLQKNMDESMEKDKNSERVTCPACGVSEGELHLLGCVVELCPWCDGQFSNCNCRFDQLGVEEITSEEELDRLEEILTAKGRIPFKREHVPAYPGTSAGLDK